MNLIDLIKLGLGEEVNKKSVVDTMADLSGDQDPAAVQEGIIRRLRDTKNAGSSQDQLKADLVHALMSIKNLPFTANMTTDQIEYFANVSVANRYFFGNCPAIEDYLLMHAVLPVNDGALSRRQIVDIIKWGGVEESEKKKLLGIGLR